MASDSEIVFKLLESLYSIFFYWLATANRERLNFNGALILPQIINWQVNWKNETKYFPLIIDRGQAPKKEYKLLNRRNYQSSKSFGVFISALSGVKKVCFSYNHTFSARFRLFARPDVMGLFALGWRLPFPCHVSGKAESYRKIYAKVELLAENFISIVSFTQARIPSPQSTLVIKKAEKGLLCLAIAIAFPHSKSIWSDWFIKRGMAKNVIAAHQSIWGAKIDSFSISLCTWSGDCRMVLISESENWNFACIWQRECFELLDGWILVARICSSRA